MSITKLTSNGLTGSKYDTVSADNYFMEPIATTLLSSTATTVTFNNIPQGYKHLQLRAITRVGAGSGTSFSGISLLCNEDTSSSYTYHRIIGNGSSPSADGAGSFGYIIAGYALQNGLLTNNFGPTILDVLDYSNVNKYKTFRSMSGYDNNGTGSIIFGSGVWMNSAAITSLTLKDVTFAANSRFSLYGIRG
jgi:hypothetical protein